MTAGQRRFISIQPLDEWPGKRRGGVQSSFRAKFTDTLDFLERELQHLGATDPTLQTLHHQDDVRVDGRLKSDTRAPRYQGVILRFKRPAKQHEFACDLCRQGQARYWTNLKDTPPAYAHPTKEQGKVIVCKDQKPKPVEFSFPADKYSDWKDNVRAIAMVLEALRLIERHGVKSEAQYAGFKALPGAGQSSHDQAARDAAAVLARFGNSSPEAVLSASRDELERIYRAAVRRTHPDSGGSHADAAAVNVAAATLRQQLGQ